MLYFAYGSNMLTQRLTKRAPSARLRGAALLRGRALRFHKRGRDGSAKCDALHTGRGDDVVHGVLFEITDAADWEALDRTELGYARDLVDVESGGIVYRAATYRALPAWIDDGLLPNESYRSFVLEGAREHGLPEEYVARIERQATVADPKGRGR